MTTKQRLLLFLYSNKNIVGCLLALAGLALYFTGIIDRFWYLIVPGLYAVGWLITPGNPAFDLRLRQEMSAEEIRDRLNELERVARKRLPKESAAHVSSIKQTIEEILPAITNLDSPDQSIFALRQTVMQYLPDTIQNYLALPPAYANVHPVKEGKTAKQLLEEQLRLLDEEMKAIAIDINKADTQRLLAHGRFLEERFQTAESWLT
jgi:hypothetical protein